MIELILSVIALIILFIFLKEMNFFTKISNFLYKKKDINWEKRYLAALKKKNINPIQIVNRLGEFYISQGRYEEATLVYEKMLAMHADGTGKHNMAWNSFVGLASVAEKKGDFNLAIEYIKKGEDIRAYFSSKESDIYLEKVCLILSRCYLKMGNKQKALECCVINEGKSGVELIKQAGEIFLEFSDYNNAKKYLNKKELNDLSQTKKSEVNYLLCMALIGNENYDLVFKMASREDFFQSNSDVLILGLYASAMANIKKKEFSKAEEMLNRIFDISISRLDNKQFYKFYYYNFLLYYGLGSLNIARKENDKAKINFQKILEIIERIPLHRYEYFSERISIYFFKFLAFFELIKMEKILKERTKKVKEIKFFLKQLTEEEKFAIGVKEIGNQGSIINKINNCK